MLVLLDLLAQVDPMVRRVNRALQDLQVDGGQEELLVLLVSLVQLVLLDSLDPLVLMASLVSKVKQENQARRENQELLDHRGWQGNQENRVLLV